MFNLSRHVFLWKSMGARTELIILQWYSPSVKVFDLKNNDHEENCIILNGSLSFPNPQKFAEKSSVEECVFVQLIQQIFPSPELLFSVFSRLSCAVHILTVCLFICLCLFRQFINKKLED